MAAVPWLVSVVVMILSTLIKSSVAGFTARRFHAFYNITELECTGSDLQLEVDVLTIVIYQAKDDRVLASANVFKEECSTSGVFSACVFASENALRALVSVVGAEDWMVYGCNVTTFRVGGRVETLTWMLKVERERLKARPFMAGTPDMTVVECSGEGLPASAGLLSITLYDAASREVIASVNYGDRKCITYGRFTSCDLDRSNSRLTRVRTLINTDTFGGREWAEDSGGEEKVPTFGCDVAIFEAGKLPGKVSWSMVMERTRLRTLAFQNYSHITEVECTGDALGPDTDLLIMVLYNVPDKRLLASANLKNNECATADHFSSCVIDGRDSHRTSLRTLLLDLKEGEAKQIGCNLTTFVTADGSTRIVSWNIYAQKIRTTTSSTTTTTTVAPTTNRPSLHGDSPVASGVKSNVQEFQLPISIVIVGLVLLLFFAILCAILVILQCRGKRRRRSRAANRESLLSQKNEPVGGEGGYRTTRSIAGYPPGHMPPETPGGNFAMRYQKSIPDTGYVSGSSVYYSEPYGTLDDEIKERLRPNPRMCHIPYEMKGGALDPHPQEHSA